MTHSGLFKQYMGRWLMMLLLLMLTSVTARAAEAYACYTPSNTTLTFYYDTQRSARTGTTYNLNTGDTSTGWETDGTCANVTRVVFDPSFAEARPTTTYSWFYGMNNLQSITGMSYLNTSEVTNMSWMFAYCESLTSIDLSRFNTANVTNMAGMFFMCSGISQLDLSTFNTSNVFNMTYMFIYCYNLNTIYVGNAWSTNEVTYGSQLFTDCSNLVGGQGTAYDSSHVGVSYAHIDGGPSNPGYLTEKIPEAYSCYTPSNTTLTFYYDTQRSARTGTTYDLNMYGNLPGWYSDNTNASVTRVVFDPSFADARPTYTNGWFYKMRYLQSITGMKEYLNTSKVTDMSYMFSECMSLTSLDLSSFNTSKVTTMGFMFYRCSNLTVLDLSSFNTSHVTSMYYMFGLSVYLRTIYVSNGWSTAALSSSSDMFFNCTRLVGGQGTTYDSSHTDAAYAHIDGGPSNPGYLTEKVPEAYACYTPSNTTLTFYYDTQRSARTGTTYDLNMYGNLPGWYSDNTNASVTKVVFDPSFADARPTYTNGWFYKMRNLQSITGMKEYLNTSKVTDMSYMFSECMSLTSIDLSSFNTSKVTTMGFMFYRCSNLTVLDLSCFNTSNVTSMYYMFGLSVYLRTIYVSNGWSTAALSSSSDMFFNCTRLVGGQGTTYDSSHTDAAYAHIDGGPSNPGYLTAKNVSLRGDVNGSNDVTIADVSALIDYLLTGDGTGLDLAAANCNNDSEVTIADVSALIDYLLTGNW